MAFDWREVLLGDVVELKRGFDLPQRERTPGVYPLVSSSGITDWHGQPMVKGPGVVTGRYGTIGQVFFIRDDFWPLNTTLFVNDFKGNDPRFISYFLRSIDFHAYSDKAAVPGVNRNHLHQARVRVPSSVSEQRAIAQTLGALDDKIELNRRMSETLESMACALFKSWFVDFDPVRAKSERFDHGLAQPVVDLFPGTLENSESGDLPRGWSRRSLGELVDLVRGRTYKSSLKDLPGPVLLGLGTIEPNGGFRSDKLTTYGGDCPPELMLSPGEMYVSLKDVTQSANLLGAVARVPSYVPSGRLTQDTVKLKFRSPSTSREIVFQTLLTSTYREFCRAHATGTTNLALSREDFLGYPIVQPNASVQELFDQISERVNTRASLAISEARTLSELRNILLPKLISGEIRVKDAERIVGQAT